MQRSIDVRRVKRIQVDVTRQAQKYRGGTATAGLTASSGADASNKDYSTVMTESARWRRLNCQSCLHLLQLQTPTELRRFKKFYRLVT